MTAKARLKVRAATADDARPAAEILAAVAAEGVLGTEPPVDVDARADAFRERVADGGPTLMLILEDAGRVVGHALVRETRTPGVLTFGMAIGVEGRGRGGGRALMEAIVAHARACGAHKLELEVWPDNDRAIALYTAAGFEVEGLRRDHYRRRDGSLRSSLIMARGLGSAAPPGDG